MTNKIRILPWNCRGINVNYKDVKRLLTDYNTILKEHNSVSFKGYKTYKKIPYQQPITDQQEDPQY